MPVNSHRGKSGGNRRKQKTPQDIELTEFLELHLFAPEQLMVPGEDSNFPHKSVN
jgi:hypothetical protein